MASGEGFSFLHQFDLGNRLTENFGDKIISVTSTAAGDFDKSNMYRDSSRLRWRSSGVATQEIIFQADISSEIDTFAIIGHNFSDSAAVILEANTTNNFVAPPFTAVIPYAEANMIHASALGSDYEYYKLTIIDPANPCGYIEIGRVVAGRAFIMQADEDISDSYSISTADKSKKMATEGFFRASNENVLVRSFSASFQKLDTRTGSDDNFQGLRTFFKNVRTTRPFVAILDRDNPSLFNVWAQLNSIPSENYGINQYVNMSFQIEEIF